MVKNVISAVIFYQLLMCAIVVALNLFKFTSNGINLENVISIYELFLSFVPTFIYCFFSSEVTMSLLAIGDIYFECPWYHLHFDQQKLFILMIKRSQNNFRFEGFSIVHCSLDIFLSVNWI